MSSILRFASGFFSFESLNSGDQVPKKNYQLRQSFCQLIYQNAGSELSSSNARLPKYEIHICRRLLGQEGNVSRVRTRTGGAQRPQNLSTNWVKFLRIEFPALTDNPPHREYMRGGQRQRFWRWGGISWWRNEIRKGFLKAQLFAMEIFKMYSPISVACQSHPCFLLQHFNLSKIGLFTLSQPLKSQSSHPSFNLSLLV